MEQGLPMGLTKIFSVRTRNQVLVRALLEISVVTEFFAVLNQVLAVLKDNYPSDKFYMTIRAYPAASALYARLCRTMQMGSLEQIYEQEDDFMGQAMLSIHESYR